MDVAPVSPQDSIGGRYLTRSTAWNVVIRACGEGYELISLTSGDCCELAQADDSESLAALFYAPRSGADRYPDWAAFEWSVRIPDGPKRRSSVWRIAESSDWAAFLGQAVTLRGEAEFESAD